MGLSDHLKYTNSDGTVADTHQGAITRTITVTDRVTGMHAYVDAPDEVAFLKRSHRHKFHVEMEISVDHDDRELEFFMVLDQWEREIRPFVFMRENLGSCEQIAERILGGLLNSYGDKRWYLVKVAEDGENWGTVRYRGR